MQIEGSIKLKPLSNNRMWQGRRFKTPEYLAYEKELSYLLKGPKIHGNYKMTINFFLKTFRTDLSNLIKPLEDCFVKAGLIEDDRYCVELVLTKTKSKEDRFDWRIDGVE